FRGHGTRPCHHPQARAHDGWRRDCDERARKGLSVHRAPAGRRYPIIDTSVLTGGRWPTARIMLRHWARAGLVTCDGDRPGDGLCRSLSLLPELLDEPDARPAAPLLVDGGLCREARWLHPSTLAAKLHRGTRFESADERICSSDSFAAACATARRC